MGAPCSRHGVCVTMQSKDLSDEEEESGGDDDNGSDGNSSGSDSEEDHRPAKKSSKARAKPTVSKEPAGEGTLLVARMGRGAHGTKTWGVDGCCCVLGSMSARAASILCRCRW